MGVAVSLTIDFFWFNGYRIFLILDTETGDFLSTDRRHAMLAGGPGVSVPLVYTGAVRSAKNLNAVVRPSLYKTSQGRERLRAAAEEAGSDPDQVALRETSRPDNSEGLYIKWEERRGGVLGATRGGGATS